MEKFRFKAEMLVKMANRWSNYMSNNRNMNINSINKKHIIIIIYKAAIIVIIN